MKHFLIGFAFLPHTVKPDRFYEFPDFYEMALYEMPGQIWDPFQKRGQILLNPTFSLGNDMVGSWGSPVFGGAYDSGPSIGGYYGDGIAYYKRKKRSYEGPKKQNENFDELSEKDRHFLAKFEEWSHPIFQ